MPTPTASPPGLLLARRIGALLVVAFGLGLGGVLLPTPADAAEKLVNAQFRPRMDKNGFSFTLDTHGRIQTQFGWLYSGFTFNNTGLSVQKRLMKPDGSEYVLEGRAGHLLVKRRFRVNPKLPGIRIIETLENPTSNPVSATVVVYTQHSRRSQRVVTDGGRNANGPLTNKEGGIVCHMQGGMQALICYQLAGPRSKLRPNVVNQNNQNMQFHYNVQIPARSKVSIAHGAVILRQTTLPSGKALPKLFKPLRSRKWLNDLPREIRGSVINDKGRGSSSDDGPIPALEEEVDVMPGMTDKLAFSEETLLQGTATCRSLQIEGSHGTATVPFQRVAAIVGARGGGRAPAVYLRDGQRLTGRVAAEGLRFEMTSGMGIDLDIAKLDRLVMRDPKLAAARAAGRDESEGPRTLPENAEPYYLFETFSGDRLRAQRESDSFPVATHWGGMDVPLVELKRMHLSTGADPGYWIELVDGSRFRAFVRDAELVMKSDLFGTLRFQPHAIRRILAVRPARPGDEDRDEVLQAHLVLTGGDVIVGHIDLDALHFLSPGGLVPQPPAQLKRLQNEDAEGRMAAGEPTRFRAEIWGGGHLTGELREITVPFRTTRGKLTVAVRDILEVHVPTPVVPQVLQTRLRNLIADLGHASWEKREAASATLADLGELSRLALEQTLRETKDPEVERRVRRLLDRL